MIHLISLIVSKQSNVCSIYCIKYNTVDIDGIFLYFVI